jgi:hypothetical protein
MAAILTRHRRHAAGKVPSHRRAGTHARARAPAGAPARAR